MEELAKLELLPISSVLADPVQLQAEDGVISVELQHLTIRKMEMVLASVDGEPLNDFCSFSSLFRC